MQYDMRMLIYELSNDNDNAKEIDCVENLLK